MANHSLGAEIEKHLGSDNIFSSIKGLEEIECFEKYRKNPESGIDTNALVKYVILLYAKDSPLNRPPVQVLKDRRLKAARMVSLDSESKPVRDGVFELGSKKVFDMVFGYLIYQNSTMWTERCTLETQIEESQRIRLKPIESEVTRMDSSGNAVKISISDKDQLDALNKKSAARKNFKEWEADLRSVDLEIFKDHEDVKKKVKRTEISLESMADD